MARAARTAKPPLSTTAKDKLLACLNWPVGLSKREGDPSYEAAPIYYDAAWEWYRSLSLGQRDAVSTIIAAWSSVLDRSVAVGAAVPAVISDRDIWRAALLIVKRYEADAVLGGIIRGLS